MTSNNHNNKKDQLVFPEAPASWNTRYVDPEGFECQITLRGESGLELLEKASSATSYLLKNGCTPYSYNRYGGRQPDGSKNGTEQGNSNGDNGHQDDPSWCLIHQCDMKRWERDGRVWYSHKVNGTWCKGK